MAKKPDLDETTRQIAQRMLSAPPKPHEKMKVGRTHKPLGKPKNAPKRKRPPNG